MLITPLLLLRYYSPAVLCDPRDPSGSMALWSSSLSYLVNHRCSLLHCQHLRADVYFHWTVHRRDTSITLSVDHHSSTNDVRHLSCLDSVDSHLHHAVSRLANENEVHRRQLFGERQSFLRDLLLFILVLHPSDCYSLRLWTNLRWSDSTVSISHRRRETSEIERRRWTRMCHSTRSHSSTSLRVDDIALQRLQFQQHRQSEQWQTHLHPNDSERVE